MFSRYFLSERDLEAIQRALTANPLLASLLMLSPIDAFTYLNLMPRFFDALLPPPAEDALLIQRVVQALAAGQTALDQPQVLQPDVELMVAEPAPLAVVEPPAGAAPAGPDIALSVSKATLQRAVGLYADGSFKGQEFVFPVQRWLDVNAIGESIDLNLFQRGARIIARLRGTFVFRSVSARLDLLPRKINFPIEI